ncbi:alanine racemase [Candidatus Dependentiae bacterium]|nr:alanine racemase [Candidatus Dependentiae bacterium]
MHKQSFIELSSAAFNYNLQHIKQAAGDSRIALVLKSNAYGHGLRECALMAKHNPDVAWTCTASISEALIVHTLIPEKPILVLYSLDSSVEQALARGIHLTVQSIEDAYAINTLAHTLGIKAFIHVKIDTGMSRLGITPDHAPAFIQKILTFTNLILYGIHTHLGDTSNHNQTFSYLQLQRFDTLLAHLESTSITIPCTHALSSSGLAIKPLRTYSLVRAGAFAYGIWKSERHKHLILQRHPSFHLEPVLQWKAPIIALKTIQEGDTVGYNNTFIATRVTTLAVVPIGYADGYPRALSNKKDVGLLKGQPISVAGLVSMNLTAFDVTDVPGVRINDPILLVGGAGASSIYACAQAAGTISNELAVSISSSVQRTIQEELFPHSHVQDYTIKKKTSLHDML